MARLTPASEIDGEPRWLHGSAPATRESARQDAGDSAMTDTSSPQPEQTRPTGRRVNWRVRGSIAAALFGVGIGLITQNRWSTESPPPPWDITASAQESVEAHALRLEQTYAIRIDYGNPADFWVAPFKPEDAPSPLISMAPADPRNVAIALDGIEAALRQYPPGFVTKFIKAVFICDDLRAQGERAGGTVGTGWILMSAREAYGPQGLRQMGFLVLHHELSSLVMRADPLTWSQWAAFAPAGWHYWEQPADALRHAGMPDPSLDTGFLNAYGATNLENDFNMYAEGMFENPQYVARLAQEHPLIRKKLDLVMQTYIAVDPAFAEIFRKMGLAAS